MSKKTILLLALIVITVVTMSIGSVAFASEGAADSGVAPTVSPKGAIYVQDFETVNAETGLVNGASSFVPSSEAHSGSFSNKTTTGEQWLFDIPFENGGNYTVTLWVKADADNTGFRMYNASWDTAWEAVHWGDSSNYVASTEWTQITYSFQHWNCGEGANVRLGFLPTDASKPIYIDDVVVYDDNAAAANLWTNGSMEETSMANISNMTRDNSQAHAGEWSAKISGEAWNYGVSLKSGGNYFASMWVKASEGTTSFKLYNAAYDTAWKATHFGWSNEYISSISTTEWTKITYTFQHWNIGTGANLRFGFNASGGAVYVDDIEVYELSETSLPADTLIANGGFDSALTATIANLASGDKLEIREGNTGKVAVLDHKAASGAQTYVVELADSIAYTKKNDFTVKFDIKVEGEGTISAKLVDGSTVLAQTKAVSVSEGWNEFSAKLEMPRTVDDSNAKLQLVLDVPASDVVVSLDNIVLRASQTDDVVHEYEKHNAVAATCTEAGNEVYYTCKDEGCNCIFDKDKIEIDEIPVIAAKGHTEVTDDAVAATCTEKGKTEGKHCSVCNAVIVAQEEVAALGHDVKTEDEIPATCTTPGVTENKYCGRCDAIIVEATAIPAKGHTEVVDAAVAPTCTEKGKTEGKHCSVCNEVIVAQEEVDATGHSWGEWTTAKEATTKEEGLEERVCSACGERETQPIPKREVNVLAIVLPCVGGVLVAGVVVFFILRKRKI